jgi:osmoprotectant transport system ATP-binding protein
VRQARVSPGPVVAPDASAAEAHAVMTTHATDWVAVVDGDGCLAGWVGAAALDGAARVGDLAPESFAAVVHPDTTLKAALDGIVTSRTRVAVVVDAERRYQGVLTVDDLAEGVTR